MFRASRTPNLVRSLVDPCLPAVLNKLDKLSARVTSLSHAYAHSAALPTTDKDQLALAYVQDLDAAVLRCRTKVHLMFDEALSDNFAEEPPSQSSSSDGNDSD